MSEQDPPADYKQMLLLEASTPVAATATVQSPGVVTFSVEAEQEGERARRAGAVLHAGTEEDQPSARDIAYRSLYNPTFRRSSS